jgi:hypothetical protein
VGRGALSLNTNVGMGTVLSNVKHLGAISPETGAVVINGVPFGMYAACSFAVGSAAQAHGITDFAKIWVWVTLFVWLIVFAAMVARVSRTP